MPDTAIENTTETELDVLLRTMLSERRAREFQKKRTIEKLFAALCDAAIDKAGVARRIAALDGENFNDRQSILSAIVRGWAS
jgi:hypothetical protein